MSLLDYLFKYPRTYHLPFSKGLTTDDKLIKDLSYLEGKDIIMSMKMDGENTSMYRDHIHARSIDSKHHSSRAWVKQLHSQIQYQIPEKWRICGENMYAQHSIVYDNLLSYFYMFSIWDENNNCLSWDETKEWAELLGLQLVPVLYEGKFDLDKLQEIWSQYSEEEHEGFVVRLKDSFHYEDFSKCVAKYVRESHVQTDQHWMHKEVVPNKLKK